MAKYRCEAKVTIEREFECEDEETAEMLMLDYMMEEYVDLDWIIFVHEEGEGLE